jgi:hypothetical protein
MRAVRVIRESVSPTEEPQHRIEARFQSFCGMNSRNFFPALAITVSVPSLARSKEHEMALDRSSVKDYVEKFWLHPCDDGIICSYTRGVFKVEEERGRLARQGKLPDAKSWQAVFVPDVDERNNLLPGKERACFIRPNPKGEEIPVHSSKPKELDGKFDIVTFHHDKGLVDCAHYVSRCLTSSGVKINQPGVDGLVTTLRKMKDTKTLGLKVSKAQGDRILDAGVMKPGDVVTYLPPKANGYSHSTMYMGLDSNKVHRITCHTLSRHQSFFDDAQWSITDADGWRFTLIHFGHDDASIPANVMAALPGWFQVDIAGKTEFYRFLSDGRVQRLNRKPTNSGKLILPETSMGYWFVQSMEIVVCWPHQGEVDRVSTTWVAPGKALGEFKFLVNGVTVTAKAVTF